MVTGKVIQVSDVKQQLKTIDFECACGEICRVIQDKYPIRSLPDYNCCGNCKWNIKESRFMPIQRIFIKDSGNNRIECLLKDKLCNAKMPFAEVKVKGELYDKKLLVSSILSKHPIKY